MPIPYIERPHVTTLLWTIWTDEGAYAAASKLFDGIPTLEHFAIFVRDRTPRHWHKCQGSNSADGMEEMTSTDGALFLCQEGIEFVSLPQEGSRRWTNGNTWETDEEDEDESQDEDEGENEI